MMSYEGFEWVLPMFSQPYSYALIYVIVGIMTLGYRIRELETRHTPVTGDPWPWIVGSSIGWLPVLISGVGWLIHAWWHAPPPPPLPPEEIPPRPTKIPPAPPPKR